MNFSYPGSHDFVYFLLINPLVPFQNDFSGRGINQLAGSKAAQNSLSERWQKRSFFYFNYPYPVYRATVFLKSDNVMRGINQASGKVTTLRSP
jgi:hypothetical protein